MIHLQRLSIDDWEYVLQLEVMASSPLYFAYDTKEQIEEYFRLSTIYAVCLDTIRIGSVSYLLEDDDTAEIGGLIIEANYRGHGYGGKAVKELIALLPHIRRFYLLTHPKNSAAVISYLEIGFEIAGWKDNPFNDGQPRIQLEFIHDQKSFLHDEHQK